MPLTILTIPALAIDAEAENALLDIGSTEIYFRRSLSATNVWYWKLTISYTCSFQQGVDGTGHFYP